MAKRIKSGIKKHRQSLKKRERNTSVLSNLKTLVKKFKTAVGSGNAAESEAALKTAASAFDKAASKGMIHRKNASRHIARLSKRVHAITKSA